MIIRSLQKLSAAFWITCLLYACGGGGGEDNPSEVGTTDGAGMTGGAPDVATDQETGDGTENNNDIELFGLVGIYPSGMQDFQTEVQVEFDYIRQSGITVADYIDYRNSGYVDICESDESELPSEWIDLYESLEQGEPVSAGRISINNGTSLFATLGRAADGSESDIAFVDRILPTGATLDISGRIYPSFLNVAIPNSAPVQVLDDGLPLSPFTAYNWIPSGSAQTMIEMEIRYSPDSGNNVILCDVVDDGSFELPTSAKLQIGDSSIEEVSFQRYATSVASDDKTLLLIVNSSPQVIIGTDARNGE